MVYGLSVRFVLKRLAPETLSCQRYHVSTLRTWYTLVLHRGSLKGSRTDCKGRFRSRVNVDWDFLVEKVTLDKKKVFNLESLLVERF